MLWLARSSPASARMRMHVAFAVAGWAPEVSRRPARSLAVADRGRLAQLMTHAWWLIKNRHLALQHAVSLSLFLVFCVDRLSGRLVTMRALTAAEVHCSNALKFQLQVEMRKRWINIIAAVLLSVYFECGLWFWNMSNVLKASQNLKVGPPW